MQSHFSSSFFRFSFSSFFCLKMIYFGVHGNWYHLKWWKGKEKKKNAENRKCTQNYNILSFKTVTHQKCHSRYINAVISPKSEWKLIQLRELMNLNIFPFVYIWNVNNDDGIHNVFPIDFVRANEHCVCLLAIPDGRYKHLCFGFFFCDIICSLKMFGIRSKKKL